MFDAASSQGPQTARWLGRQRRMRSEESPFLGQHQLDDGLAALPEAAVHARR